MDYEKLTKSSVHSKLGFESNLLKIPRSRSETLVARINLGDFQDRLSRGKTDRKTEGFIEARGGG